MIEAQPQDKVAVIEDGKEFTYHDLLALAEEKKIPDYFPICGKQLYFIRKDTVIQELAEFLACQGGKLVPVILSENMTEEERTKLQQAKVPENAVMGVLTSGTTGKHKILFRTYESWADYFPYQNEIFSMGADTVLFAQGSLSFTGNMNLYMALLSAGGTVVATKQFKPHYWLSLIKEYRVNYIYLIPAKMLALTKAVKEPCISVKHFVTGSQSFGKKEVMRVKNVFPELSVVLYYGSSEANYITYLTDQDMTEDFRLVGKPFPRVDVWIQNGVFYVDNNYGIIGIEHPFCTGDLGSMDEEGYFYFEGRQDDLLNVNGKKCSAYRIEQQIREKLGIEQVMVSVLRDGDRDYLAAFYEDKEEKMTVSQMKETLRGSLSGQEIPKRFVKVDSLPKTDSGKIKRSPDIFAVQHHKPGSAEIQRFERESDRGIKD